MEMNNIRRFLFESAHYLDLDPAQAFRDLHADATSDDDDSDSAGYAWLQSLCGGQHNVFQNCST